MVDQIFAVTKGFLQGRRPHVLVLTSPNVTAAELVHGDWDFVICTVQCLCLMDQINLCLTQLTVGNYPDVQDPVSPPSLFYLGLTPLGSLPTANLYCPTSCETFQHRGLYGVLVFTPLRMLSLLTFYYNLVFSVLGALPQISTAYTSTFSGASPGDNSSRRWQPDSVSREHSTPSGGFMSPGMLLSLWNLVFTTGSLGNRRA